MNDSGGEDWNPETHCTLNTRDEIAAGAPIIGQIFTVENIGELAGLKPGDTLNLLEHLPIALARWRYRYAEAVLKIRKESKP